VTLASNKANRPGPQRTFPTKAKSYDRNTTAKQLASDLAPVIAAVQKADDALLRVNWPDQSGQTFLS
jgi:hypothetical protein